MRVQLASLTRCIENMNFIYASSRASVVLILSEKKEDIARNLF